MCVCAPMLVFHANVNTVRRSRAVGGGNNGRKIDCSSFSYLLQNYVAAERKHKTIYLCVNKGATPGTVSASGDVRTYIGMYNRFSVQINVQKIFRNKLTTK